MLVCVQTEDTASSPYVAIHLKSIVDEEDDTEEEAQGIPDPRSPLKTELVVAIPYLVP